MRVIKWIKKLFKRNRPVTLKEMMEYLDVRETDTEFTFRSGIGFDKKHIGKEILLNPRHLYGLLFQHYKVELYNNEQREARFWEEME